MFRLIAGVAVLAALTACSDAGHHDDPMLIPAGSSGAAALGQPVTELDTLVDWVQNATDECDDAEPATEQDLRDYLGPTRFPWYASYVGAWATCKVAPYEKIGLVVFAPGAQAAFQESWAAALRAGEDRSNPDWAFGNGFAVTAGPLGVERLGLRYLMCEPGDIPAEGAVPSDVEGCVFAALGHRHE
ncbi:MULTISPECIES: hypothetical protein [Actinokineospora]|uniref:Uncharacterized protein n=1 Tax=Actinokineospora fastidiosa TaxID=1816 RepID=A0A918GFN1_9PSEU|nr:MULTISPECIES: hypothetical protein [Actinokineospora]UVS80060.1 hypothetical protein Actkin_03810 [Actinokineospora sp. UTMC 2448]GGS32788.1 hypothetical protein GCM10010171_28530 [Actinokineospora fastidiosa]